jgi:HSP20 family molecular chaperone IbpA
MRSRDPRTWMWAQALEMLEQADRLHRQFFEPGPTRAAGPCWQPPIDIVESGGATWILVALPGVASGRVQVSFEGGVLVVRGERPLPAEYHEGVIRRLELPYGRFERRIAIPSGHFELHEQRFENGCLVLGLRRAA